MRFPSPGQLSQKTQESQEVLHQLATNEISTAEAQRGLLISTEQGQEAVSPDNNDSHTSQQTVTIGHPPAMSLPQPRPQVLLAVQEATSAVATSEKQNRELASNSLSLRTDSANLTSEVMFDRNWVKLSWYRRCLILISIAVGLVLPSVGLMSLGAESKQLTLKLDDNTVISILVSNGENGHSISPAKNHHVANGIGNGDKPLAIPSLVEPSLDPQPPFPRLFALVISTAQSDEGEHESPFNLKFGVAYRSRSYTFPVQLAGEIDKSTISRARISLGAGIRLPGALVIRAGYTSVSYIGRDFSLGMGIHYHMM